MNIGNFEEYGSLVSDNGRYKVKAREDHFDLLPIGFDAREILEFGCADGTNLCYFGLKFGLSKDKLIGVDIVRSSALRADEVTFVHSSAENFIKLSSTGVDLILLSDVLEHLYNPWKFLSSIRSWLNPGGRLLISVPNLRNLYYVKSVISGNFIFQDSGFFDQTHIRFFSKKTLCGYLTALGYRISNISYRPDQSLLPLRNQLQSAPSNDGSFAIEFGEALLKIPKAATDAYFGQQVLVAATPN